jgi:hypothetical protein
MNDRATQGVARIRECAERCRQFSRHARSDGIAAELAKLAGDYDRDAARLEAFDPGSAI